MLQDFTQSQIATDSSIYSYIYIYVVDNPMTAGKNCDQFWLIGHTINALISKTEVFQTLETEVIMADKIELLHYI